MAKETNKVAKEVRHSPLYLVRHLARHLAQAACWGIPIGYAAKVNLDSIGQQGSTAAAGAIILAVLGAVSVHNAWNARGLKAKLLPATLVIIFFCLNLRNALSNYAGHSDTSRDTLIEQKRAHNEGVAEVSQVSQDRKEQAAVAGSATPDAIEADINAAKAADANRWKSTEGCNQEKITAGPSKDFCSGVAKLKAKLAAAKRRDELDAKLTQLKAELAKTPAPGSTDSFVDVVAETLVLASQVRSRPSEKPAANAAEAKAETEANEKTKKLISVLSVWLQAVGVEIVGEFGPTTLLTALGHIIGEGHSPQVPVPAKARGAAAKREEKEAAPARPDVTGEPKAASDDAEIDAFLAACVDFVAGGYVGATPLFESWQEWCERHGIDLQSQGNTEKARQMAFSKRIKRRITREPNNGRPRYAGIALRMADTPRFKVVTA